MCGTPEAQNEKFQTLVDEQAMWPQIMAKAGYKTYRESGICGTLGQRICSMRWVDAWRNALGSLQLQNPDNGGS